MANPALKFPENAPGTFFVDESCIDCDLCRTVAPAHFKRQEAKGYAYVFFQPVTAVEEDACLKALNECPVQAIGHCAQDVLNADAEPRSVPSS